MSESQPSLFEGPLPLGRHDIVVVCARAECGAECHEDDVDKCTGYCPDCGQCPTCGMEFAREEGYDVNGEMNCPDCVHHCEACEFVTTDESEIHSARVDGYLRSRQGYTKQLCEDCSFQCHDCSNWFDKDISDGENASGNRVCLRCAENYSYCDECNATCHSEDMRFLESSETHMCVDCYRNYEDKEESGLYDHDYKPDPIFNRFPGEGENPLFLGWEIECEGKKGRSCNEAIVSLDLDDSSTVYCKLDGSLTHGFEMVSHPGTWKFWQGYDWDFMPGLVELGYRSYDTSTCGMHVHVSKSWVDEKTRYKLLLFFRDNGALISRLARRDLYSSYYAKLNDGSKASLLRYARKPGAEHEARYAALNTKPEHTVEFRLFRGTLNVRSIKRNLALVVALCHFAKNRKPADMKAGNFLTFLCEYGLGVLGEPEATDLRHWVTMAVAGSVQDDKGE